MAKMFEVKTMKGSRVMAKMAGMESTAKTMSVDSMASRATKSGVAVNTPQRRVKNLPSSYSLLTGNQQRNRRITQFFSGSVFLSLFHIMLMPVKTRSAPKTYIIQWNRSSRARPPRMKVARRMIAPRMPQKRTLCWKRGGTRK